MATKKAGKRPAKKSSSAKKASRTAKVPKNEAISQLTADHARVKKMFKQYDRLAKADAELAVEGRCKAGQAGNLDFQRAPGRFQPAFRTRFD